MFQPIGVDSWAGWSVRKAFVPSSANQRCFPWRDGPETKRPCHNAHTDPIVHSSRRTLKITLLGLAPGLSCSQSASSTGLGATVLSTQEAGMEALHWRDHGFLMRKKERYVHISVFLECKFRIKLAWFRVHVVEMFEIHLTLADSVTYFLVLQVPLQTTVL